MPRVLIAEDMPDAAELLRVFVTKMGHAPTMVTDGTKAVRAHADDPFDLLILDAAMPVMDGFTAAKEIRERDDWTPILMITAHQDEMTVAHARRAGVDHVIYKPYDPPDVIEAVGYLLQRGRQKRWTDEARG